MTAAEVVGRMRVTRGQRAVSLVVVLAPFVIIFGAWQLSAPLWSESLRQVFATPSTVVLYVAQHVQTVGGAALTTTGEAIVGYAAGNCLGFGFGLGCHVARRLGQVAFPLLVVGQAVPVITFSTIVIIWFGNDLTARAVLAGYLCFFPMVLNVYSALGEVDPVVLKMARALGATRSFDLLHVELPSALPAIFVALKASVVLAMSGAIVGELFGATTGLGPTLLSGLYYEKPRLVWAAIYLAAALCLGGFAIVGVVEKAVVRR